MVSRRTTPDARILCGDRGVRVQPGRWSPGRETPERTGLGCPPGETPAGFGAGGSGDTGTPCLAPSEVVGDEHAEEHGQHAAGLAGQHGRPQRPVLLDQAGRIVLAGDTARAARPARQPGPPVRPRCAWGQSDSRVKSPHCVWWHFPWWHVLGVPKAPPAMHPSAVAMCHWVKQGPWGTHLPGDHWPRHRPHKSPACSGTGNSRGRSRGSPGGHTAETG